MTEFREPLLQMIRSKMDARLKSQVDASDIVQEAFASAFRKLESLAEDRPDAFYSWLSQIARNRMIDAYRKAFLRKKSVLSIAKKSPLVDLVDQLSSGGESPSTHLIRKEKVELVQQILDEMRPNDREVIVLRHVEKKSSKVIAEELGISESAVKQRIVRALQRFRDKVEEIGGDH